MKHSSKSFAILALIGAVGAAQASIVSFSPDSLAKSYQHDQIAGFVFNPNVSGMPMSYSDPGTTHTFGGSSMYTQGTFNALVVAHTATDAEIDGSLESNSKSTHSTWDGLYTQAEFYGQATLNFNLDSAGSITLTESNIHASGNGYHAEGSQLNVDGVNYGGYLPVNGSYTVALSAGSHYAYFLGYSYALAGDFTAFGPSSASYAGADYKMQISGQPTPEPCTFVALASATLMMLKRRKARSS